MDFVGLYNYWIVVFLMMAGLYLVIEHGNLVKKMVGLTVFQAAVTGSIGSAVPPALTTTVRPDRSPSRPRV